MAREIEVFDGPSRWDLMLSLFDWNPGERGLVDGRRSVVFNSRHGTTARPVTMGETIAVVIDELTRDPTRENGTLWFFKGVAWGDDHRGIHVGLASDDDLRKIPVRGSFSTATRTGRLTVL